MTYADLTINQKISLKGIIAMPSERASLFGNRTNSHKKCDLLRLLWLLNNDFRESLNMFMEELTPPLNPKDDEQRDNK